MLFYVKADSDCWDNFKVSAETLEEALCLFEQTINELPETCSLFAEVATPDVQMILRIKHWDRHTYDLQQLAEKQANEIEEQFIDLEFKLSNLRRRS